MVSIFRFVLVVAFVALPVTLLGVDGLGRLHLSASIESDVQLLDFEEAKSLQFLIRDGKKSVRSTDVVRWGVWQPPQTAMVIWTVDDCWLVGKMQFDSNQIQLAEADWLRDLAIPIHLCRGIVLTPPADALQWDKLTKKMAAVGGDKDVFFLRNGQEVHGVLAPNAFFKRDAISGMETAQLNIEISRQTRTLDPDEVLAIVFSPALRAAVAESPTLTVGLQDGTRLQLLSWNKREERQLALETRLPIPLETLDESAKFATAIEYLSGIGNNVTWLGDTPEAQYRHLSTSLIQWQLGKNRDGLDRALMLRHGLVDRGLAMHSTSQATYRWDGSRGKLLCEVVLANPADNYEERVGSVQCKVLLARDGKLTEVFVSDIIRPQGPPVIVDVDVSGSQLVILLTEQADVGQFGDHALWLDARLVKE